MSGEQCALVHGDLGEATEKAKSLISVAVEKARMSTPARQESCAAIQ